VRSLEHSLVFYRDVFELQVAERLTFGGEELAFLRIGSARLELIQAAASDAHATGVLDHVAFEVHDLDALLSDLNARGVELLDPNPVPVPALNARIAFCLGPDGERIELFEYL
jgi:catechol 2,3-dioxygenase-like lactoylglutathione lyase family enzyme